MKVQMKGGANKRMKEMETEMQLQNQGNQRLEVNMKEGEVEGAV